ncbi:MAG: DUF4125 family protein [Oscillospiraceae bacterium]|jgi:hypothetical protein|nr:DUF4125 family protein [Oscillospiraceae bacterium]
MRQNEIEALVQLEWTLFQQTQNEGGRASCQDDWETFHTMRTSQAMGWSEEMVRAWTRDLEEAWRQGRNLVTEKYARMMAHTAPETYRALEPALPPVPEEAAALARALTDQLVAWAEEAQKKFPLLCGSGRPIHAREDGPYTTSLETYHLGELLTFSLPTLRLFEGWYREKAERGENLYLEIQTHTARLLGYPSLEAAEQSLRSAPVQGGAGRCPV